MIYDMGKHPGGRPMKYQTVEELELAIDGYFQKCDQVKSKVTTKAGKEIEVSNPDPYTLEGLAVHLGIDRRTLFNYSNKSEFFPAIKIARDKCQADLVRRALKGEVRDAPAIFLLKNNYGYTDKLEHGFDHDKGKFKVKVDFGK